MRITNLSHGPVLPGPLPKIISQLPPSNHHDDPVDYESILTSSKRKLVLHFDINETMLVGDEAGGDTVHDCLNKIIAKSAFVKCPPNSCLSETDRCMNTRDYEPTQWWDGSPLVSFVPPSLSSSSSHSRLYEDASTVGSRGHTAMKSTSTINIKEQKDQCDVPPPLYTGWQWPMHCCPYYRTAYRKYAKTFTEGHGSVYRPLYHKLEQSLLLHAPSDEAFLHLPPSHPFFRILPSFFYTLVKLQEMKRDYTLVLRTFGSDLEDIALALNDFARGKHPHFPSFYEPRLILEESHMFRGRYRRRCSSDSSTESSSRESIYDLWQWQRGNHSSSQMVASGDDQVLNMIENLSVCGIEDDYEYWSANGNAPSCGKPVWIHQDVNDDEMDKSNHDEQKNKSTTATACATTTTTAAAPCHHLFFDDNIHNDAMDSIVAVRARRGQDGGWKSLSGEETIQQHGSYVVRVPTIAAILQED